MSRSPALRPAPPRPALAPPSSLAPPSVPRPSVTGRAGSLQGVPSPALHGPALPWPCPLAPPSGPALSSRLGLCLSPWEGVGQWPRLADPNGLLLAKVDA